MKKLTINLQIERTAFAISEQTLHYQLTTLTADGRTLSIKRALHDEPMMNELFTINKSLAKNNGYQTIIIVFILSLITCGSLIESERQLICIINRSLVLNDGN